MEMVKGEIASLVSLLESGILDTVEAANLEIKIENRRTEAEHLQKELEKLIRGQLRQRKFRQKMRNKML